MPVSHPSDRLKSEIAAEIATRGPIPFARFMELCLYHPPLGYYTRGMGGGGGRDYVTSSGMRRAVGALLARQVEEMWRRGGRPDIFQFVEFGPGEGRFAADFMREATRSPAFAAALRYVLVEASPALQERQRARLKGRTSIPVSWADEAGLDARAQFTGCLFANEVLDAFPVHRVVGTPEGPREIHVAMQDGEFLETRLPLSGPAIERFLAESAVALESGQEADINLAAPCWIAWTVGLLQRGHVVVVDYGYEAEDLYVPERRRGTLLAYHLHRTHEDFLDRPGEQDLTAHLDFTALRRGAPGASVSPPRRASSSPSGRWTSCRIRRWPRAWRYARGSIRWRRSATGRRSKSLSFPAGWATGSEFWFSAWGTFPGISRVCPGPGRAGRRRRRRRRCRRRMAPRPKNGRIERERGPPRPGQAPRRPQDGAGPRAACRHRVARDDRGPEGGGGQSLAHGEPDDTGLPAENAD